MTVERILPTGEARDLLDLATDLADRELAPKVTDFETRGVFPREVIRTIGRAGLLGLPYPEETAAPPSPTRSTCRCWRSSRRAGSPSPRR